MNKPSQGQVLNAIAILMNNADWDAVNASILQKVIDNPREAGAQFTAFLKNGGRVIIGEPKFITVDRTTPFDPATFIGEGWSIEEQDERSLALGEIDPSSVCFNTTLKPDEVSVGGEKRLKRLIEAGNIRLDARVFQVLWENQHLIPESWKEKVDGNIRYITFDGTILRNPRGDRYVLCLCWFGGEWYWNYDWFGSKFDASSVSAVLAS